MRSKTPPISPWFADVSLEEVKSLGKAPALQVAPGLFHNGWIDLQPDAGEGRIGVRRRAQVRSGAAADLEQPLGPLPGDGSLHEVAKERVADLRHPCHEIADLLETVVEGAAPQTLRTLAIEGVVVRAMRLHERDEHVALRVEHRFRAAPCNSICPITHPQLAGGHSEVEKNVEEVLALHAQQGHELSSSARRAERRQEARLGGGKEETQPDLRLDVRHDRESAPVLRELHRSQERWEIHVRSSIVPRASQLEMLIGQWGRR